MNIGDFVCPALKLVVAWMFLEQLLCKADSKLIIGPAHIAVSSMSQYHLSVTIRDVPIYPITFPIGCVVVSSRGTCR